MKNYYEILCNSFPKDLVHLGLTIELAINQRPQDFLDYMNATKEPHARWSPTPSDEFYTLDYWIKTLEVFKEKAKNDQEYRFFIKHKEKVIGSVNFTQCFRGVFQNCNLGYSVLPDYEGKGVISKSLNTLIPFIMKELEFHRIAAGYIPENLGSARVLEKQGFHIIGTSPNYLKINNKWQDHVLTALTCEQLDSNL